jgi:hypothetical protein
MLTKFRELLRWSWNPKPIDPPRIDDLSPLDPLTRSAEAIRYSILSVEFWVSSDGQVREWLRNNGRLALLLSIPGLLVIPLVVFILVQIATGMDALVSVAGSLVLLPLFALVLAVVLLVLLFMARLFTGGK